MNSRLTIQDLAVLLAERTGKSRSSAEQFLREFIAILSQGVFADKIAKVKGLGTFKVILVEKRESIHVNTGERFVIPAHYKFSFLPDKELRELVNKPFSFFETTELSDNVDFTDLDTSSETEEKETEDESVEEILPESEVVIPDTVPVSEEEKEEVQEQPEAEPEPEPVEEPAVVEKTEIKIDIEITEEPEFPTGIIPEEPEATSEEPTEKPPLAADFPDTDYPFDDEPTASPWVKRFVIAGVIVIAVATGTFLYLNRNFLLGHKAPTSALTGRSLPGEAVAPADTTYEVEPAPVEEVNIEEKDTATTAPSVATPAAPAETPEVLAKVKIETGSRLTLISLEYYGSKIFWVYLYDYNKAAIKDPNNIPVGTEILVPAPALYGIDKHSRASIDKAAARQTEILAGNL